MQAQELYQKSKVLTKEIKEKLETFENKMRPLYAELKRVNDTLDIAFKEEKLYLPMTELKRYEGKIIDALYLVPEEGEDVYMYCGYGMTAKGDRLVCLGTDEYNGGFNIDKQGRYYGYAFWNKCKTPIKFIGFYGVRLFDPEVYNKSLEEDITPFSAGEQTLPSDDIGYYKDETTTKDYLLRGREEGE